VIARVTFAEVDAVRTSVAHEVQRFEAEVLPELREADGFEGCTVLTAPEGRAIVLTFWRDEQAASAVDPQQQTDKFVTILRAPAGRETYDVALTS
jgi:heme-degrading monooxygenase HmoA